MAQLKYIKPVSRVHIGSSGLLNRVKITKISSPSIALRDGHTSQRNTSPKVASKASSILRDSRTSKSGKSVAGSALSQSAPKGKKQS